MAWRESKSNECALFDKHSQKKKSKSIQLKKREEGLCTHTHTLISYPCVCMSHILLAFACLTVRFFFIFISPIDLMDVHSRQTRSIAHKFPALFMCQTKVASEIYVKPKRIQRNSAQHTQMFVSNRIFQLRLTSSRQETVQSRKVRPRVFGFMLLDAQNDFDASSLIQKPKMLYAIATTADELWPISTIIWTTCFTYVNNFFVSFFPLCSTNRKCSIKSRDTTVDWQILLDWHVYTRAAERLKWEEREKEYRAVFNFQLGCTSNRSIFETLCKRYQFNDTLCHDQQQKQQPGQQSTINVQPNGQISA